MTGQRHGLVELARLFTVEWINRADPRAPERIVCADYVVHISGVEIRDRARYAEATLGQLEQFPGLTLTVHDLICDGQCLAMAFSEHGSSTKHDGRLAAWRGVALFNWDGNRLTENWTQEDYFARRRQLQAGSPDAVAAPMVAPWAVQPAGGDVESEAIARAWVSAADFSGISVDDGLEPGPLALAVDDTSFSRVFSAGRSVAFAATLNGIASPPRPQVAAALDITGLVHVREGRVSSGTVVTDRLGLHRRLTRPQKLTRQPEA